MTVVAAIVRRRNRRAIAMLLCTALVILSRSEGGSEEPVLRISGIDFERRDGGVEAVLFRLDRYQWPVIEHAVRAGRPVLEIRFDRCLGVFESARKILIGGNWIGELETAYSRKDRRLMVSVVLEPGKRYRIGQRYDERGGYFEIGVGPGERTSAAMDRGRGESSRSSGSSEGMDRMIEDRIGSWVEAWEGRDIDRYMLFYHAGFQDEGMSLGEWKRKKAETFRRHRRISVGISELQIGVTDKDVSACFRQVYRADGYSDVGDKCLDFRREEGEWRIYREVWSEEGG